ncbi:dihydropteroate synthase, partial [Halobacteriales archaeon QS_5_70_17]
MEYHEAVDTLERLRRLRPKLGTETTASLLAELGDPHEGTAAVQVAGSNGKGSTARMLERVLREAGLDVGLYTSPDLNDLRERVRVNGRKIPKHRVVRFVEEAWPRVVEQSAVGESPTFFEAFTALALWHFDREGVDVAVLEVGIGGRYDATSVVDPVAAAVTTVSLEHTDILGSTVEEIARDKAQVAPTDRPLVTGATGRALGTIREETDVLTVGDGDGDDRPAGPAADGGSETAPAVPDVTASETGMVSLAESSVSLAGDGWEVQTPTPLLGRHQATNAGIAAALARQVGTVTGTEIAEADVAAGLRNVSWPGRCEVIDDAPLVVLDGAHNPDACAKLSAVIDRFDYEDLHLVFGAMLDKDHAAMADALPAADRVLFAEPAVDRAQDTDTLAAVFGRETGARTEQFGAVLDAVGAAVRGADPSDCVLVTGSLYTVAEARDRWTRTPVAHRTTTRGRAASAMRSADIPAPQRRERADRMVSRTVRLHARREAAVDLKERMLSQGGTGAVSGITAADEHVDVVLSGTLDQFRGLVRELRGNGSGSRHLAAQLNAALESDDAGPDGGEYPWEEQTAVMGILNVTPDSFHDGGEYDALEDAVARAEAMVAAGA